MLKGILLSILIFTTLTIKLRVTVDRNKGPVCFYESLKTQEKYKYKVTSDIHNFRMDVMYSKEGRGGRWEEVVSKMVKKMTDSVNKITEKEGIYTFCISTPEPRAFKATLQIETGLQQVNLEYLPTMNDHQILLKEILWMQKQKQTLQDYIQKIESRKSSEEILQNIIGYTLIALVVIGLLIISVVNFSFFLLAKKVLKDRKMI